MPGLRADTQELLEAVRSGAVSTEAALERLAALPFRDLVFARPDLHRELRQGAPEAVLAEGKTPSEVAQIVQAMVEGGAGSVLVTRADEVTVAAVRAVAGDAQENPRARMVWVQRDAPAIRGVVTIVSAGTSDGPVVEEARVRAQLLGCEVVVHEDVGVAGCTGSCPRCPTSSAPIAWLSWPAWMRRWPVSSAGW